MNKTPFYDSCYQQEDDNDILLQLLKSKISIDESTGIRTIDCDKDVFRQEGSCVIASDGDRLHMCLTMGEEVEVPDGGSNGIWSRAGFDDTTYDRTNGGMSFSISSPSTTWYPASGCRNYDDGSLSGVGHVGFYWSASPYGYYAYSLFVNDLGGVYPSTFGNRAHGYSVRCLQE